MAGCFDYLLEKRSTLDPEIQIQYAEKGTHFTVTIIRIVVRLLNYVWRRDFK